jgi:hypothetical protein
MNQPVIAVQAVPEKTIRQAAHDLKHEGGTNSFIYALESGKIFKQNNLSPLYLLDSDTMTIYVTSKQYAKNLFH